MLLNSLIALKKIKHLQLPQEHKVNVCGMLKMLIFTWRWSHSRPKHQKNNKIIKIIFVCFIRVSIFEISSTCFLILFYINLNLLWIWTGWVIFYQKAFKAEIGITISTSNTDHNDISHLQ